MACCRRDCGCNFTAGEGLTLTGNGSSTLPIEYSLDTTALCDTARGCFTAGDGLSYDQASGEFTARLSSESDNATVIGPDGGIYTPVSDADDVVVWQVGCA